MVPRLRAAGAELVGELVQYEDKYRLWYVRGLRASSPLAEQARAERVHCRGAGKAHLAQMTCRLLPGHRSWSDDR